MKKFTALLLAILMAFSLTVTAFAADDRLTFNVDGKFRILQINDFQDTDNVNEKSADFLNKALDKYKPDLVVLVGDQLRDGMGNITVDRIKTALTSQLQPLEDRGIPFLFTFGNHDRDYINTMSMESQAEFYRSFSVCMSEDNGPDAGTSNTVIYAADGKTPVMSIYMMDTKHWNGTGWTSGVTEDQVEWYKQTSNELKAQNGGEPLPSLVFQHIPVKEIYQLLKEVPEGTPDAVKGKFANNWYVVDENADLTGDRNVMREAPASEHPEKVTGQYEAWVEQGDIIGAYFGHDHINTFAGRTNDGIVMGYNGGFGFATYGDSGERYATLFEFDLNDVANYKRSTVYYTQTVTFEEPSEPDITDTPEEPEDEEPESKVGFFEKIKQFFEKIFEFFRNLFS